MSLVQENEDILEVARCASCGLPPDEITGGTPLCSSCRKQFVNFPTPLWIKVFAGVLLIILAVSFFSLPKNIRTGVHYKRGLRAMEQKNFLTAEQELAKVATLEPDYLDAKCKLLIASYYNMHFDVFFATSQSLEHKNIEDQDLFNEMQSLVTRSVAYFPRDSFMQVLKVYQMQADSIPVSVYRRYLSAFPQDHFAALRLASVMYDQKQIREADSLLSRLLREDPNYFTALYLKASIKRELQQLDSSYYYIQQLLSENHQDVLALASKVRTLLKEKKDKEALQLAKEASTLDAKNAYALGSLALAYHFNRDVTSREAALQAIAQDTSATEMARYVRDVISGKEKFRN